jgi:type VI secretion system protein ImpA
MSSPVELDFDLLLAPIPGDDPAGQSLPFQVKEKLDEMRKEINPDSYAPNDPNRPELKKADWNGIIRLSQDTLSRTSKDLTTAIRLTEALTKQYEFAGLRAALTFLNRMISECWDRMYPLIEEGDLEVRAAPFSWLDDPSRGGRFPTTLRTLPLVGPAEKAYSYLDWERAKEGSGKVKTQEFDQAIQTVAREPCQMRVDDITGCLTELNHLLETLNGRFGAVAPGLLALGTALKQCDQLAQQVLQRKGPAPVTAAPEGEPAPQPETNGEAAAPTAATAPPKPRAVTREDLYRQLAATASQLQVMEPHSPIPILIQRAVELGSLPFPQLMAALVKDQLMAALLREPEILQQISQEVGKRLASK